MSQTTRLQPWTIFPPLEPIDDWNMLSPNDEVTLRLNGKEATSGRVDMLAINSGVLWLIQNEGKGRAMFHYDEGLLVFRV